MTNSFDQLPPEMRARLEQILANNQQVPGSVPIQQPPAGMELSMDGSQFVPQKQPQPQPQPQAEKPPTLAQHVVALRHEVAHLNQQVAAMGQVLEAVGGAVGQIYAALHQGTGDGADF